MQALREMMTAMKIVGEVRAGTDNIASVSMEIASGNLIFRTVQKRKHIPCRRPHLQCAT